MFKKPKEINFFFIFEITVNWLILKYKKNIKTKNTLKSILMYPKFHVKSICNFCEKKPKIVF